MCVARRNFWRTSKDEMMETLGAALPVFYHSYHETLKNHGKIGKELNHQSNSAIENTWVAERFGTCICLLGIMIS